MNGIPLCELWRPTNFNDIILNSYNKQIFKKIIETSYFPNLLFFGPPGVGKTTTIINLINSYQEKIGIKNKDLIIHLNASDERGIDIIRNQINSFVNSNSLFNGGMKFVILDEVDYMTKNAQQALKYLLQNYSTTVRFCLICNYISKIDEGLQNEFIKLHFNELPKQDIINLLQTISISENLNIDIKSLENIQQNYKSDIRSMINFIQTNQDNKDKINIIDDTIWKTLIYKISKREKNIYNYIINLTNNYNIDNKNIIKFFLNYIIQNNSEIINSEFLDFVENIMHSTITNNKIFINYALTKLQKFIH